MKIIEPSFVIEHGLDGIECLKRIERSGRTCYKSEDKITDDSAVAFVKKIIASGHHSVLEHESVTVRIICDRGVSHEIVRHRIASYSQESTRYCNYAKDRFGNEVTLCPMQDNLTGSQVERRIELWQHIEQVYFAEIADGIKPQQARDNLPTCLKTEIVCTYNVREWRHFFTLRTADVAHPLMRKITRPMLADFRSRVPILFDDVGVV